MNKSELIETVSTEADINKAAAERALNSIIETVTKAVTKGDRVTLVGFGTFAATKRKASTGRNPRTGEEMQIPESTTVRFKVGKQLKDAVN